MNIKRMFQYVVTHTHSQKKGNKLDSENADNIRQQIKKS